ncbi:MAG: FAD-dependent oxidoreductase [Rubrivivax sp.]
MSPVDVRVVGGGFAGFWAALAARRVLGPGARVSLVSAGPLLQLRPRLYEADPRTLAVALPPLLERCGIAFEQACVAALDAPAGRVHTDDGTPLQSRRLVLASGSVMAPPPLPGVEHAWSIDTQAEAIAFDERLRALASGHEAPVIAVLGAGFTGIELALELRDRIAGHGGAAAGEAAQVLLLDRAARVGAELGAGPRPAIEAALDQARIERHLGVTVDRIEPQRLHLRGLPPRAVHATVLATGLRAAPLAAQVPGAHDALGRVRVDDRLRAPAAPALFVCGDAAAADTGGGRLALQSCQHALRMGRFAGENAARDLLGRPLLRYGHERYVTCLDLGRAGAVFTEGWARQVRSTGAEAKAIKQRINRQTIVPPPDASGEQLLALSRIDGLPDEA